MSTELGLLMALRVQGVSPPERAARAVGADDVTPHLLRLASDGAADHRPGKGYTLTADGRERLEGLLAAEGLRTDVDLREGYDRFLGLNGRVLEVCSAWQVRSDGGIDRANDHTDADYDAAVIADLEALHDRARVSLKRLAACADRYMPYRDRLDDCLERLLGGDRSAFTAPLAESYHTVWFELHQDLLLTLDLEREEGSWS